MKEAGLNPALFYAKGGQGGSTGGGQAQGVGLPSKKENFSKIGYTKEYTQEKKLAERY